MVDRSLAQKGRNMSASEGLIGYSGFAIRPIERVGEFVEVVPGIVATLVETRVPLILAERCSTFSMRGLTTLPIGIAREL